MQELRNGTNGLTSVQRHRTQIKCFIFIRYYSYHNTNHSFPWPDEHLSTRAHSQNAQQPQASGTCLKERKPFFLACKGGIQAFLTCSPVSVLALGLYTNSNSQISQARFFTYADKTTCMLQKYSFSLKVFATSHPIFWSYEYYLAMTISENPDPKLMLDSCHCYLHCFIEKYE